MIIRVVLSYEISGFGKLEYTTLRGLKEEDEFLFGNPDGYKVKLKKVDLDKVVFQFDKHCMLVLPNNEKEIEIKKGEEIRPFIPINPSPSYKIKIEDITEEPIRYYE